jgi:thiol:disulfide interchange protein DsbC
LRLKVKGLCEVVAGKNVFYATADGQKVFIGEVLDLKSKTNITAARISELASMASAEAKIAGGPRQAAADQTPPPAAPLWPASSRWICPRTTR